MGVQGQPFGIPHRLQDSTQQLPKISCLATRPTASFGQCEVLLSYGTPAGLVASPAAISAETPMLRCLSFASVPEFLLVDVAAVCHCLMLAKAALTSAVAVPAAAPLPLLPVLALMLERMVILLMLPLFLWVPLCLCCCLPSVCILQLVLLPTN